MHLANSLGSLATIVSILSKLLNVLISLPIAFLCAFIILLRSKMSFGYSIGDFIAGANLSYKLFKALSSSRGASQEYQEAVMEISAIHQAFLQVGRMTSNPTLSHATINAASCIVLSSMSIIDDFLERTKRYRERLCGRTQGNTLSDSWQKMGWALFGKEELKALKDALHLKLNSISVLLATAQL